MQAATEEAEDTPMSIRQTLPVCDECSKQVVQSFHAILGGKIYRLCSDSCRRIRCARHSQPRPEAPTETGRALVVRGEALPRMPCGAYGDEWDRISDQLQEG
jgi:hypothetical protein